MERTVTIECICGRMYDMETLETFIDGIGLKKCDCGCERSIAEMTCFCGRTIKPTTISKEVEL